MKALGLHQPYAGLIRLGIKTIETRFWSTTYRGPVLICATRSLSTGAHELVKAFQQIGTITDASDAMAFQGTMQCIVDIVDCRLGTEIDEEAACCRLNDVNPRTNCVEQKYAFVLANLRSVVRKPVKCGRKWFNIDDADVELEA